MCRTIIPYEAVTWSTGRTHGHNLGWQTRPMQARSALFDVYGDHLRARGSEAPVAAVVRLLNPVGIAAPAVRTAISRMVTQGWLEPVQLSSGRGYRTTEQANRRLDEAGDRVYRRHLPTWDGRWHLAFVDAPAARATRNRLRADLTFVGYAELADNVWVSPFARAELGPVLERAGATARTAWADGFDPEPTGAWDLSSLRAAYEGWLASADGLVMRHLEAHDDEDEAAFAARFHLVHEWRKFLFDDPGLPEALLPGDWPGRDAAALFASAATRLKPGTDRFVARCLSA
ncbi:phenylacetic acid degradation operon negative regulatory protein PaaX [Nocardioides endophyticus]|uniref:Phenylacetic acid degradation operon negative regulatory protein PaaX n=2 Tax=Nocardioides endophyticus TaxID=1353775 RepID=A0ABP8YKM9_9ACTN